MGKQVVEVGIFFLQLSKVGLLTNAVKNDCNYNACYPFSDAFKISVEILVKLLKAKPQSSLQDKFYVRSSIPQARPTFTGCCRELMATSQCCLVKEKMLVHIPFSVASLW